MLKLLVSLLFIVSVLITPTLVQAGDGVCGGPWGSERYPGECEYYYQMEKWVDWSIICLSFFGVIILYGIVLTKRWKVQIKEILPALIVFVLVMILTAYLLEEWIIPFVENIYSSFYSQFIYH